MDKDCHNARPARRRITPDTGRLFAGIRRAWRRYTVSVLRIVPWVLLVPIAFSGADLNEAQVKRAREATALVINPKNDQALGTAFCIDPSGYFITTQILAERTKNGILTLVLEPGGTHERKVSARVVNGDASVGLALLKSEIPVDKTLDLGDDSPLQDRAELVAFGFHIDHTQAADNARPALRVMVVRIATLDRREGRLVHFRMDPRLGSGISGGPVLDVNGRVVGVVASETGRRATVDRVIPVSRAHALLSKPILRAEFPETIPWPNRHNPVRLKVAIDLLSGVAPPDELTLTLDDGYRKHKIEAEKTEAGYVFEGPLLTKQDPAIVRIKLTSSETELSCFAENSSLRGPSRTYLLSELDGYDKNLGLQTRTGEAVAFEAPDIALKVYVAGSPVEIPLREIDAFHVAPLEGPASVRYRIDAGTGDARSAGMEGRILFIDESEVPERREAQADTLPLEIQAHEPFTDQIVRRLPAPITDVTLAGNGRYMLLRMDKIQHLAVFDVVELEVIKFIPLPHPKSLIAGGASTFVLALPEEKVLQRWSLATLELEATKTLGHTITNIALGSGAEGPLMLRNAKYANWVLFLDLYTFDTIRPLYAKMDRHADLMDFRVSADGRTIGARSIKSSGISSTIFSLTDSKTTKTDKNETFGYLAPGPRGEYIYTHFGVLAPNMTTLAASPAKTMTFPTTLPAYFLGRDRDADKKDQRSSGRMSLYKAGSSQPLVQLPETPEFGITNRAGLKKTMTIDKLVHFVPQARILMTIPARGDHVVARYVDLEASLKVAGQDYFFVDSFPVIRIRSGSRYLYQIQVKSSNQKIRYARYTGPEGMEVGKDGLLSWNVPKDFSGPTQVIVNIQRGDGQELFHTFKIEVVPPIAPAEETVTKEEEAQ